MKGEPGNFNDEEITDINSFLRASWFQVADQYFKTRIMRPQFKERSILKEARSRDVGTQFPAESARAPESPVTKDNKAEEKANAGQKTRGVEEQKTSPFVPSSAVYVSAFHLSSQRFGRPNPQTFRCRFYLSQRSVAPSTAKTGNRIKLGQSWIKLQSNEYRISRNGTGI